MMTFPRYHIHNGQIYYFRWVTVDENNDPTYQCPFCLATSN
jgi:hypothetical protein